MQKIYLKRTGFVCMFLLCLQLLLAQEKTVSGTVKDINDEPLIGVSVFVKGTTIGTATDLDGRYHLSVPAEAKVLVASYIGMLPAEANIQGSVVDFVLKEDLAELEEVVVIGYGTVRKRDITGSVASVSDKQLKDLPVASVAEAITGRMAGVSVTAADGSPDADIRIRVRGGTSISQDNSPLYVVDGIITSSISDIPPSDIVSLDILKDAASTAIYGAMGANGVVLITTKGGREGKISVTFNTSFGVKTTDDYVKVLDPYEYVYYQYELDQTNKFKEYYGNFHDLEIYKSDRGIDWQDRLFGNTGTQQYYNLGISGGSKAVVYSLSYTRNDEDYIMLNSGYVRDNLNLKVNTKINDKVGFDFNVRLSNETINGPSVSSGSGSNTRLRNAVKFAPTRGLKAFDSSLDDDDTQSGAEAESLLLNPIESIENEYRDQNKFRNSYIATFHWNIRKDLKFTSMGNYTFNKYKTENVWLAGTGMSKAYGNNPIGQITTQNGSSFRWSNTLSYNRKINDDHYFDVLLGQEMSSERLDQTVIEARNFPGDFTREQVLAFMEHGESRPTTTSLGESKKTLSFFGRVNYNLMDKYMLTFTARRDGVSVFGPGQYWGFFPGGALAWRVSEESFLKDKLNWLDNLKMRLSYGAVGNAKVDPYWRQEYTSNTSNVFYLNEKPVSILYPANTLKSNGLTWETTYSANLGIDFGLFANRLSGSVDIYNNTTKDLIVKAPIPSTSGYEYQFQNVGQTTNRGLEFALTAYLIDRNDFSLSANFNIAFNSNKVDKFMGNADSRLYGSGWNGSAEPTYDYLIEKGKPLGQMYGYVTEGMYSFDDFDWDANNNKWVIREGVPDNSALIGAGNYFGPGALKFKKIADDGKDEITENDRKVIGNALPKHTGGFGFNMAYKGFDASVFFNWSWGNDIYNANKIDFTNYHQTRKYQNLSSEMSLANRFTTIDPVTGNNIYHGTNANPELLRELNANASIWHPIMTTSAFHSWAVEDGSFLRLNNLTVGYTLPKTLTKKWLIESLRVYVTGYNLYCWTNYSGPDPEVSTRVSSSNPFTPGVDYSAYPKSISFVGGVNITF